MNTLRRVAVIDCGTNTFNLRIVDVGASAGWIPVFGQRVPVKLGQGGVAKGIITADRMARGLDALIAMRAQVNAAQDVKTSINDYVIKASALARK